MHSLSRIACMPLFLLAVAASATESGSRTPELAGGSVALQVLTGLGFVTCAIFALAWVAKRLGGAKLMQHGAMNIVAAMPVGTREKIVLLNVNNTNILVGVTAQNISSLHVFEEGAATGSETDEHSISVNASPQSSLGGGNKWDFSHYIKQFAEQGLKLRNTARPPTEYANLSHPGKDSDVPVAAAKQKPVEVDLHTKRSGN